MTYLDIFESWDLPVYLVTRHYLGSINHTLLSLYALVARKLEIKGLIISGTPNSASETFYRTHFPDLELTFIPELETISPITIAESAHLWKQQVG